MNTQRIIIALVLIVILAQVFANYRGEHLQSTSTLQDATEVFAETFTVTAAASPMATLASTVFASELLAPAILLVLPVVIGYYAHPMIKRTFDAAWDSVMKKPTKVVQVKTPSRAVVNAQPILPPPPHETFHTLQQRIAQTAELQNYTDDTLEKRVELMSQ